jgi:hypothetical protein
MVTKPAACTALDYPDSGHMGESFNATITLDSNAGTGGWTGKLHDECTPARFADVNVLIPQGSRATVVTVTPTGRGGPSPMSMIWGDGPSKFTASKGMIWGD